MESISSLRSASQKTNIEKLHIIYTLLMNFKYFIENSIISILVKEDLKVIQLILTMQVQQ